jgi:hypothetical protein
VSVNTNDGCVMHEAAAMYDIQHDFTATRPFHLAARQQVARNTTAITASQPDRSTRCFSPTSRQAVIIWHFINTMPLSLLFSPS